MNEQDETGRSIARAFRHQWGARAGASIKPHTGKIPWAGAEWLVNAISSDEGWHPVVLNAVQLERVRAPDDNVQVLALSDVLPSKHEAITTGRRIVAEGGGRVVDPESFRHQQLTARLQPKLGKTPIPAPEEKPVPPGWRSDAFLIRELFTTYGEGAARYWRSLPLIDLRAELPRIEALTEQLQAEIPHLRWRPFSAFVMDLGLLSGPSDNASSWWPGGHIWALVTDVETWVRHLHLFRPHGGVESDPAKPPDHWLVVGLFIRSLAPDMWVGPVLAAWNPDDLEESIPFYHGPIPRADDPAVRRHAENVASASRLGVMALRYLAQTPKHFVEVRPSPNGRTPRRPSKDRKPWTRADLPHIMLLDPTERTIRHTHTTGNGTRAPLETGHRRRGCVVTLLAPRFYRYPTLTSWSPLTTPPADVQPEYATGDHYAGIDGAGRARIFVRRDAAWYEAVVRFIARRDAWVGPREWSDQATGALYRVLDLGDERG